MEEQFLDLGFVDQSLFENFDEIKEDDGTKPNEQQENQEDNPSDQEDKTKEEETKKLEKEGKEDPSQKQDEGSPNISSSIAEALVDEGALQTLDKERLSQIKTTEDLIEAFKEDLRNQLDEEQKRISDAMKYGVEPTRIQQYEQWIKTLDSVTDDILEGEDEQSENYRKNLIYQNYIIKGFDQEEATDMVNRSVDSGKDLNDAKKALSSLKSYYNKAYSDEVNSAKKEYEKQVEKQKKQFNDLKDSIIEDKENFFDQFEINKSVRQKIFDAVAKPSITDGDMKLTPIQKFIKDDPNKANKIIGTLYVITDGFTKFDGILKGTVKKQVRKSVENLERVLAQTKTNDGSMIFKSGIGEDNSNLKMLDFDFDA